MQKKYFKQTCRVPKTKKLTLTWFNRLVWFSLAICLVYYVAGINNLAVKGFGLQELKVQARTLSVENEEKQARATNLESLYNLKDRLLGMELVVANDVTYITVADDMVAKR